MQRRQRAQHRLRRPACGRPLAAWAGPSGSHTRLLKGSPPPVAARVGVITVVMVQVGLVAACSCALQGVQAGGLGTSLVHPCPPLHSIAGMCKQGQRRRATTACAHSGQLLQLPSAPVHLLPRLPPPPCSCIAAAAGRRRLAALALVLRPVARTCGSELNIGHEDM